MGEEPRCQDFTRKGALHMEWPVEESKKGSEDSLLWFIGASQFPPLLSTLGPFIRVDPAIQRP